MNAAVKPRRQAILEAGIAATVGDRNRDYGDPTINLACAGELRAVFRKYNAMCGRVIGAGEQEAVDQVMTKIGRVATGKTVKEDTYVDGATYFAIAGECAAAVVDWPGVSGEKAAPAFQVGDRVNIPRHTINPGTVVGMRAGGGVEVCWDAPVDGNWLFGNPWRPSDLAPAS